MWSQFFWENIHFAVSFLTAFALFSMAWLYFDAWTGKRTLKDLLKIIGLGLLSVSFVIHASFLETTVLHASLLGAGLHTVLLLLTRLLGYLFLLAGLLFDPLEPKPQTAGLFDETSGGRGIVRGLVFLPVTFIFSVSILAIFMPILAAVVGLAYLRRATIGLENHLKPISLAFFVLSLSEWLSLRSLFMESGNITLLHLTAAFGFLWVVEHGVMLVSTFLLIRWVWRYLLTRLQSQLFMIYTATVLAIFLLTTVVFTGLLLKSLQDETVGRLATDVKVLSFALESKRAEVVSDAQLLAKSGELQAALQAGDRATLALLARNTLLAKKQSTLVILSESGQVLARGEDRERIGDSLSDDPLVERTLFGKVASGVVVGDGLLAAELSVRASAPVVFESKVIGVVLLGTVIDNAFVDGIKSATGLEAIVFGGNVISAATLAGPNPSFRAVGLREENERVKTRVLTSGQEFTGETNLAGTPYFGAYLPLLDIDATPIGMLFVGKPQSEVLGSAARSIELTFVAAVVMILVSLLPAYLIARFIAYQVN